MMNLHHAERANKASKFDKRKDCNPLYLYKAPHIQSPVTNQKDNTDGNGDNNKQRR